MRKVVLALVLVNLVFFGWQWFGGAKPEAVPDPTPETSTTRLVMLAELPPGQRPAARAPLVPDELPAGVESPQREQATQTSAPESEAVSAAPAACFHLAGFPSAASATRIKALLEQAGAVVSGASAERFARIRYWVLLPPSRSQAQALAMVTRLKQAGVKDYYLIPDGPNQNAISLGVFSAQEGAKRRVAEMAKLKLKVRVEKVDYPGRRYALDARWPADPPAHWQGGVPAGIEITSTACAAPQP